MKIMDIHFVKTMLRNSPCEETFNKYLKLVMKGASDEEFFFLYDKDRLMTKLDKALK